MEAESRARHAVKARVPGARRLQKTIRADEIRLDEGAGRVDGAVHMAFRREVHDDVGLRAFERGAHGGGVRDVGLHKGEARRVLDRLQRIAIACVGQLVDHEHIRAARAQQTAHDRRADEARAARDKDVQRPRSRAARAEPACATGARPVTKVG